MTDRDVIAEALRRWPLPADQVDVLADAIATALDAHHTITTREELDALPFESVVRDRDNEVFEAWFGPSGEQCWVSPGMFDDDEDGYPLPPVRVLYRPGEGGSR